MSKRIKPAIKRAYSTCDKLDCAHFATVTGTCDYLVDTGHLRSLICTVKDCTCYEPCVVERNKKVKFNGRIKADIKRLYDIAELEERIINGEEVYKWWEDR